MNSFALHITRVGLATLLASASFAANDGTPLPTGNLAQLAYTDGQPALRALDQEIAAAGTDAAKLNAIADRLVQELGKSGVSEAGRQAICQRLGTLLTEKSPLAANRAALKPFEAMLTNDREVEFVRLALEPVPGAAIDQLFTDAVPASKGRARLAILQALGARRTAAAVPAVARLLGDADAATSAAAAHALAAIGNPAALTALQTAANATAPHVIAARLDILRATPVAQAAVDLQQLAVDNAQPAHVRGAALRTLLDLEPAKATERIVTALSGSDWTITEAAAEAIAASKAPNLVSTLNGKLTSFDAATQAAVISGLGRKGDASSIGVVTDALKHADAGVRAAAIDALARLPGSQATVAALAEIAAGSGPESGLARQSLTRINGPQLDQVFLQGAQSGTAKVQGVYIEQLGARNIPGSATLLNQFRKASDPALRGAAALALRETAPPSEQGALLAWAMEATDATELTRVLQALIAVTQRKGGDDRSAPIITAIEQAQPEVAIRLIPVLPRLGDDRALAAAVKLALGGNAPIATAATGALARSNEDTVLPHLVRIAEQTTSEADRRTAQTAALRLLERDQWWQTRVTRSARQLYPTLKDDGLRRRLVASLHQARDDDALTFLESVQPDPVVGETATATIEKNLVNRGEKGKLAAAAGPTEWRPLFDGKSLSGWKSNETPGVFTVEDGMIKVSGGRSHLYHLGYDEHATFRDFEFRAKVKTTPGSNSGIFFHTAWVDSGWPTHGYEAQVNNTQSDRRKTGSLYAVKDVLDNAPAKDGEWFDYYIRVEGNHVVIKVNGETTVDWSEPADWPTADLPHRKLSSGTFALQGHDPKSTVYYKEIFVRRLPFTPRAATPAKK